MRGTFSYWGNRKTFKKTIKHPRSPIVCERCGKTFKKPGPWVGKHHRAHQLFLAERLELIIAACEELDGVTA